MAHAQGVEVGLAFHFDRSNNAAKRREYLLKAGEAAQARYANPAAIRLPWFEVEGVRLLKRVTLIIRQGRIAHCIYPVFPPDRDAETVMTWIRGHGA